MSGSPTPPPDDPVVGREDLVEEVLAHAPEGTRLVDVVGPAGSGKTTFLKSVRARAEATGSAAVFAIAFGESDRQAGGSGLAPDGLSREYSRLLEVMTKLVKEAREILQSEERSDDADREMRVVKDKLVEARQVEGSGVDPSTVRLWAAVQAAQPAAGGLGHDATMVRGELAEVFAERFPVVVPVPRVALITVDGFEWIAGQELAGWVLDIVRRLPRTTTVVARTREAHLPRPPEDVSFEQVELLPFNGDEIQELLAGRFPESTVGDDLVRAVERFSGGHAQGTALAADVLERLSPEQRTGEGFDSEIHDPSPDFAKGRLKAVDTILSRDGEKVTAEVRACSALRQFDAKLLAAVFGQDLEAGEDMIDSLRKYPSFIEAVPDAPGTLRISALVREALYDRERDERPESVLRVHQAAADHYADEINEYEDGNLGSERGSYGAWYRYEQPEWQELEREWLYHETRVASDDKRDKEASRLRFARVFLDAFWWWGCYIPFAFNRTLLDEWRETQKDVEWTDRLGALLDNYPTGYQKASEPARWLVVLKALLDVRRLCGISSGLEELSPEQRYVRGLIDIFTAQAHRYGAVSADSAERHTRADQDLDEAVGIFRDADDDWNLAWTLLERADLHVDSASDDARGYWSEAAGLAGNLGDHELVANLHRVAADARWPHSPLDAFTAHGRAVLHGYLFQGRYQGQSYRPDAYTLEFYTEQVQRTISRLVEHASAGGDVGEAVNGLRAALPESPPLEGPELARLCAEGDQAGLLALFPRAPREDELLRESSDFLSDLELHVALYGEPSEVGEAGW